MKILSVYDKEFAAYGKILEGYDVSTILAALKESTPLPEGVQYVAEEPALMNTEGVKELLPVFYGGLPAQVGFCNGHNTKLNCLEYHRDSEFNLGLEDFVLILGHESEIEDGKFDTAKCKAFRVPAGVMVECYATSLHYAPCHADPAKGFKVMCALPKGTNMGKTVTAGKAQEDKYLWSVNKWLLAHPEAPEAAEGAYVGLVGENIDIAADL